MALKKSGILYDKILNGLNDKTVGFASDILYSFVFDILFSWCQKLHLRGTKLELRWAVKVGNNMGVTDPELTHKELLVNETLKEESVAREGGWAQNFRVRGKEWKLVRTMKGAWSKMMAGEPGKCVMMEPKEEENFQKRERSNGKRCGIHPFIHSIAVNHSYDLGILVADGKRNSQTGREAQLRNRKNSTTRW